MRRLLLLPALPLLLLTAEPAAADPWAKLRSPDRASRADTAPRALDIRSARAHDFEDSDAGEASQVLSFNQQSQLGGGFIEFLFSGQDPRARAQGLPRPHHAAPVDEYERRGARPGRYPYGNYYEPYESFRPGHLVRFPREIPGAPEASPNRAFDPRFARQIVRYSGREAAGTVIINTDERFLYLVQNDGTAIRYGVGVGREGFEWKGAKEISAKREWPDWHPPEEMLRRRPDLPTFMAGGPDNPLGARALYLGSSLYRIHGSNEPWTIGQAVSSGCFRMRNEDVIDLYERVKIGTRVIVI